MHQFLKIVTLVGFVTGLTICGSAALAADAAGSEAGAKTAKLLSYARLYTGADDETHFEDVGVDFVFQDYGAKMPTVWLPADGIMDAAGFHFVSMPAGWDGGEWHPAPRRQFIIPLNGEMEFQASDGERRVFGPGDVLLVEDTTGKGHISRMVSASLGVFAVVPLPDPAEEASNLD